MTEGKRTLRQTLDEVAAAGEQPLLLEELTLHRILLLFAVVYGRLRSSPVVFS